MLDRLLVHHPRKRSRGTCARAHGRLAGREHALHRTGSNPPVCKSRRGRAVRSGNAVGERRWAHVRNAARDVDADGSTTRRIPGGDARASVPTAAASDRELLSLNRCAPRAVAGPASRASAESRFIATRLSSALHNAPQRDVAMPRCESCGRVVGLCACPGPNEMGEVPSAADTTASREPPAWTRVSRPRRRRRLPLAPPPPPRGGARRPRVPPRPGPRPFDEFNRRRAVKARVGGGGGRRRPRRSSSPPGSRPPRTTLEAGRGSAREAPGQDHARRRRRGRRRAIRRRLRRGEHPDQSDFLRRTPTHVAAAGGAPPPRTRSSRRAPTRTPRRRRTNATPPRQSGQLRRRRRTRNARRLSRSFPKVDRNIERTFDVPIARAVAAPPPPPPRRGVRERTSSRGWSRRRESRREGRRGKTPTPRGASGTLHRRARASRRRRGSRPRETRGRPWTSPERAAAARWRMLSRYARWRATPDEREKT